MSREQAESHPIDRDALARLWRQALDEDGADHDVTTQIAFVEDRHGTAHIRAREPGIFAGRVVLDLLAETYRDRLVVRSDVDDGRLIDRDTAIACLDGSIPLMLSIERTVLNFLQRLCGVATLTGRFVEAVRGTGARIYDTRKTIPGWRMLDKYAVRCGGGCNHRFGLHDAVLVKDNHLAGVPADRLTIVAADMLRRRMGLDRQPDFVEFEADDLEQLDELLRVPGVDVILLDNFTIEQMRQAVALRNQLGLAGKVELEASGNVTLETVRDVAETGVERIAVGALTHSAPALDLGMDIR